MSLANILFLLTLIIPTLGCLALWCAPNTADHDRRVTWAVCCLWIGLMCGLLWAVTA